MTHIRIIPSGLNGARQSPIRTLNDALDELTSTGELYPDSKLELLARAAPDRLPLSAALLFKSVKNDQALFPLPISKGFWATTTLGNRRYMMLDQLDGAEVDCDGNVRLRDDTFVHAVSFDIESVHVGGGRWTLRVRAGSFYFVEMVFRPDSTFVAYRHRDRLVSPELPSHACRAGRGYTGP